MNNQSNQFNLDIPNFGQVPVRLKPGQGENDPGSITHARPSFDDKRIDPARQTDSTEPFVRYLGDDVERVDDPSKKGSMYAVLGQKIVTLTTLQLVKLTETDPTKERLRVRLKKGDQKIDVELQFIEEFDCNCEEAKGSTGQTVLLVWEYKNISLSRSFPDVLLFDPATGKEEPKLEQTNNFVLSSDDGGPNSPPPRPPWTSAVSLLNSQSTDFKLATPEDIQHYEQFNGQDRRPSVAVLDTGLKFKIHDEGTDVANPYAYQDADGIERQFNLAYHDPGQAQCDAVSVNNPLGFCAIQSYRQPDQPAFINVQKPYEKVGLLSDDDIIKIADSIKDSPYDDCRIFEDAAETVLQDARHGSTVTALIQQNGNNAPVVPVKAFDNVGMTTLFDMLNGFNYILCQQKSANIRVINASWICTWDEPLLRAKIEQLMKAGIFVIAAAGNEKQTSDSNLDVAPAYPACYSQVFPNVITVTSVRKTYIPHTLMSRQGDSIVSGLLKHAIRDFGLFGLLETGDDIVGAVLPTAGYIAVENYSTTYVNVGVVSTFGYFRSPFWTGKPIRGSSFACALVSAFVISQLSTRTDILPAEGTFSKEDMDDARQKLLTAMSGVDDNLKADYVNGGYYLAGYEVD